MHRGPLACALPLALLGLAGCASTAGPPATGVAEAGAAGLGAGRQALYRLTYDTGEGRTTLKVVLRQEASGRFQLVFSDLAGRRVWSLDYGDGRSVLVDHRNAVYCVDGPELALPDVQPMELPLAAIPRVLAGRPPVAGGPADGGEWVDSAGRQWRSSYRGRELVSWTLLDGDGPSLWWQADREGGILSRRGGAQYRWSLVVGEPFDEPLRDLVPAGFAEEDCGG